MQCWTGVHCQGLSCQWETVPSWSHPWLARLLQNPLLQPHPNTNPIYHKQSHTLVSFCLCVALMLLVLLHSRGYSQSSQLWSCVVRWMLSKGKSEVLHQGQEPLRVTNLVVTPPARQLQPMTEALLQLRMGMISQHNLQHSRPFQPETPPTLSTSLTHDLPGSNRLLKHMGIK